MSTPDPDFAARVLRLVGGAANVAELTHCLARLRFVLHDDALADDEALQALPDVVIVVRQGGQLQLALRLPVPAAYTEVERRLRADAPERTTE